MKRFIGREAELARMKAALRGDAVGVVLAGQFGIGKSKLAQAFVDWAESNRYATQWALATRSTATVPFGALASVDTSLDNLVLRVDDAHLLDEASAELLYELAMGHTAFVVLTVQRGVPAPDMVTKLITHERMVVVDVPALSQPEVDRLLADELDGHVDTVTMARIATVCGGNPLFISELLTAGREFGALRMSHSGWTWTGPLRVNTRLTELVGLRLADLSEEQLTVTRLLALGEPLDVKLLRRLTSVETVDEMLGRELIVVDQSGETTLAHPVYAEVIASQIGPVRKRMLLRKLAEALAATGARRRDDALRLAIWRLESGPSAADDGASRELVDGARRARALFDHHAVERLTRASLTCGGGFLATVLLGDALYWQGRHAEAAEVLRLEPPRQATSEELMEWATVCSSNDFWGFADLERAENVLRVAESRLAACPERERVTAHRASLQAFAGLIGDAVATAEGMLESATDDEARLRALSVAVPAWAHNGRPAYAAEVGEQGMARFGHLLEVRPLLIGELVAGQAFACLWAGQTDTALQLATTGYQHVVQARDHDLRGIWATLLGRIELARGQVESARRHLREAVSLLRPNNREGFLSWALSGLAVAAASVRDLAEATAAITQAQQHSRAPARIFDSDLALAVAWIAAQSGELTRARRLAMACADDAEYPLPEMLALHCALRCGADCGPRLAHAATKVDGRFATVLVKQALGQDCAAEFGAMGLFLYAAETATQARKPQAAKDWLARCEGANSPILRRNTALTSREQEIAELTAHGLAAREVAAKLELSTRTVTNHLASVYSKLGVTGREALRTLL